MKIQGKVHKYGDHVDTDVIIPARYLNSSDPKDLAAHCMEDIDKEFVNNVKEGDMAVAGVYFGCGSEGEQAPVVIEAAGVNFGCGSSREHAPLAIKAAGVSCVIAKNFARIFYRNALNIGLPILECPEAGDEIEQGDEVSVDFDSGVITDNTTGKSYRAEPFPPFIQDIIKKGGLLSSLK